MTIEEIQKRISALNNKLLDNGFTLPDCQLHIHSDRFWVVMYASHPSKDSRDSFREYISGETPSAALEKAEAKVIPNVEKTLKQSFVRDLGELIDKGRKIGIDVDFINPLEASMRKLSENILEYWPEPEPLDAETVAARGEAYRQQMKDAGRGHQVEG